MAKLTQITLPEADAAQFQLALDDELDLDELAGLGASAASGADAHKARAREITMGDDALDSMVPELNNILDWVEQLGEVDVTGVEPMTAVIPNTLRLREDEVDAIPQTAGGRREDVLANAPAAEHGFFGVPKVIE